MKFLKISKKELTPLGYGSTLYCITNTPKRPAFDVKLTVAGSGYTDSDSYKPLWSRRALYCGVRYSTPLDTERDNGK